MPKPSAPDASYTVRRSSSKRKKGSYRKKKSSTRRKSSRKKVSFRKKSSYRKKSSTRKKSSKKRSSTLGTIKKYASRVPAAMSRGSRWSKYGRAAGAAFGPYGSAIGAGLGAVSGAAIGLISGSGDYRISQNSIAIPGQQIPSFDKSGHHCHRIRHREYIGDVTGSTSAFLSTSYTQQLNPGNSTLFPWLSTLAAQYEEYRFEGLIFEYRSISGVSIGSTNNALGYVAMAVDYNASDPAYTSKLQLDNAEFAVSGPPSANILLPVECKRSETVLGELYCNTGGIPTTTDARMWSLGLFNLATGNQQAAYVQGELWCSYDVCFYKPKLGTSPSGTPEFHANAVTSVSTSAYFGNVNTIVSGSTFAPVLGATTITFPANMPLGSYLLFYGVVGSNTNTLVRPVVTCTSGCADFNTLIEESSNNFGTAGTPTSTSCNVIKTFSITAPSAVLTFSGATLPTSITSMDLMIIALNPTVVA